MGRHMNGLSHTVCRCFFIVPDIAYNIPTLFPLCVNTPQDYHSNSFSSNMQSDVHGILYHCAMSDYVQLS